MTTQAANRARYALADCRYFIRVGRDSGEIPVDVARVLLASLSEADDALARYEGDM